MYSQAWRMLTRSFLDLDEAGRYLAYTPMIHSRLFTETASFRNHHFQARRSGLQEPTPVGSEVKDLFLDGNPSLDRPLFVQFCANSPEKLLEAAKYVQAHCDAVDLNLGCPQGIARKGNYGAFLQEDWGLIHNLIRNLHDNLRIPVTAKIRILETKERTLEYAKMVLAAGASILTVHGRQRHQKGHESGLADWTVIRYLRDHLPADTVIFANGNVIRHEDLYHCLEETGADGVMSAEGNLFDPSIFAKPPAIGQEGREYWRGRNGLGGYRVDAIFRRYMDIIHDYVLEKPVPQRKPLFLPGDTPIPSTTESDRGQGHHYKQEQRKSQESSQGGDRPSKRRRRNEKPDSPNLLSMQAHLFSLLRTFLTIHKDIRPILGQARAGDIPTFESILTMVEDRVRKGLLDYETSPEKYDSTIQDPALTTNNIRNIESSAAAIAACRRPWWVCQSYIRPSLKEAAEKGSITLSKKARKDLESRAEEVESSKPREIPSEREQLDRRDGMPAEEMPREATVCG